MRAVSAIRMKLSYTTRQLCLFPQAMTVVTARSLPISEGTFAVLPTCLEQLVTHLQGARKVV